MRKLLILLACLILIPLAGTQTASADPLHTGYWAIHNQGDSDAWLDIQLQQNGAADEYDYNLLPGHTAGEPSYELGYMEAQLWYLRSGWCAKWRINDGPLTYQNTPAPSGVWIYAWDGASTTNGTNVTYVKTWNC